MITDDQLRELIAASLKGRQNADKRATRTDARAALGGDECCRESLSERFGYVKKRVRAVVLPVSLADAIDRYLATDWKDGRDPSKLGALNAVAYIGEQLVGLYARANGRS